MLLGSVAVPSTSAPMTFADGLPSLRFPHLFGQWEVDSAMSIGVRTMPTHWSQVGMRSPTYGSPRSRSLICFAQDMICAKHNHYIFRPHLVYLLNIASRTTPLQRGHRSSRPRVQLSRFPFTMSATKQVEGERTPRGILKHYDTNDYPPSDENYLNAIHASCFTPQQVTFSPERSTQVFETYHPEDYDRSTIEVEINPNMLPPRDSRVYGLESPTRRGRGGGIVNAKEKVPLGLQRSPVSKPPVGVGRLLEDDEDGPRPRYPRSSTPLPRYNPDDSDEDDDDDGGGRPLPAASLNYATKYSSSSNVARPSSTNDSKLN